MKKITKKEAIEDIRKMFGLVEFEQRRPGRSFYILKDGNADFFFDKKQYERSEVISNLEGYFEDKVIEDGMLRIEGITFVWTHAKICDREQNNNN